MGNLRDYIIRRILVAIPTLIGISILTFSIIHFAPGGPLNFMLEMQVEVDPEMILYMEQRLGLDKPVYVQYWIWLKNIVTGDLGTSFISNVPVAQMIVSFWKNTLVLSMSGLILSLFISIPLGIISAVKKDSILDNTSRLVSLFGVSMPNFWTGIMLIYLLAVRLGWFPVFGAHTIGAVYDNKLQELMDLAYHMVLPLLTTTLGGSALTVRLVRSSMLDVLNQEYIMTARAKGVKERVVIYKHALRNALLPVVTLVGLSMGFLLSGSITLETVFAWPGLGRYMIDATFLRDYPAIMAMTMIVATMVVVANIVTDVTYALLDPRIRY